MATTYAKTAAGQHEIETRARRLPPRARSLLILVDGKRSDADLALLVPNSDDALAQLLEGGLIQAVRSTAPAPTSAAPASAPAAGPTANGAAQEIMALRRQAVRAVTDLLGPAGDGVALKLEKAADPAAIRAQLEKAVAHIAALRGGGPAAEFASRFLKSGG